MFLNDCTDSRGSLQSTQYVRSTTSNMKRWQSRQGRWLRSQRWRLGLHNERTLTDHRAVERGGVQSEREWQLVVRDCNLFRLNVLLYFIIILHLYIAVSRFWLKVGLIRWIHIFASNFISVSNFTQLINFMFPNFLEPVWIDYLGLGLHLVSFIVRIVWLQQHYFPIVHTGRIT